MTSPGDLNKVNGDIFYAEDISALLNVAGANFIDNSQLLFNADYLGFGANLNDSGNPNMKNVFYSTFTANNADVNYGFVYDGTNDLYKTPALTESEIAYIDIYATSVNTGTLSDNPNGVYCYQIRDGIWRILASTSNMNESINRIFYELFFDLANGATDPNGVTGLTELRCSESDYQGQNVVFSRLNYSSSSAGTNAGEIALSLSGSSTYKISNDWGSASLSYGPGINATTRLEAPTNTVLHTFSLNTGTGTSNSWDHRQGTTIHSITSTTTGRQRHYTSSGQAITNWNTDQKAIWIIPDSVTPTFTHTGTGTAAISDEIAISSTAPDTVTYPMGYSALIFKDTTSEDVKNAVATINLATDDDFLETSDLPEETTTSTTPVLQKEFTGLNIKLSKISIENKGNNGNGSSGGGYCRLQYTYSDLTTASQDYNLRTDSYQLRTLVNPNPDKVVSSVQIYNWYPATAGTGTAYIRNGLVYASALPIDSTISISADGGANWTDVDSGEVANLTEGTELWRRVVVVRTNLKQEDKVTEQSVKYNLY